MSSSDSNTLTPEALRFYDEMYLEPTREEGVHYIRAVMSTGRIDHVPESLKSAPWNKNWRPYHQLKVKDRYDEVFAVELEGWYYGITNFPGEASAGLVYRVIKEMRDSWAQTIRQNLVFNITEVARGFSKAAKYLVPERDIAICILSTMPPPHMLDEDGQYVIALLVDQAEQAYGGVLERLQRRWMREQKLAA